MTVQIIERYYNGRTHRWHFDDDGESVYIVDFSGGVPQSIMIPRDVWDEMHETVEPVTIPNTLPPDAAKSKAPAPTVEKCGMCNGKGRVDVGAVCGQCRGAGSISRPALP